MMLKILACSEAYGYTSSYSLQMKMLMENINAEWYYVEQRVSIERGKKKHGNITCYPGGNHEKLEHVDMMHALDQELHPDIIFVCDDPQHVLPFMEHPFSTSCVAWFAYDADDDPLNLIDKLMITAKNKLWTMVCMSKSTNNLVTTLGHDCDVAYCMVDDKIFFKALPSAKHEWRQQLLESFGYGARDEKEYNILLYVGRLSARKNVECLLGMMQIVMRKLPKTILVMNADKDDPALRGLSIMMELVSRNLQDNVMFNNIKWGRGITSKNLNCLYNCADLYVSASTGEGFGIPIMEAARCGVPFVVPDNTTGPEFSNGGMNGFLAGNLGRFRRKEAGISRPVVDVILMAERVINLLNNKDIIAMMGENALNFSLENCSIHKTIKTFSMIFAHSICEEVVFLE